MKRKALIGIGITSFLVVCLIISIFFIPFSLSREYESYQFNFDQEGGSEGEITYEEDFTPYNLRNRTTHTEYVGTYDLSSAEYVQSIDTQDTLPTGASISSNGLYLYEIGNDADKIYQFDLDEAYDLSSAEYIQSIDTQDTAPTGISISSNGLYLYEIGSDADKIYQFDLDEAYDLSSAEYIQSIDTQDTIPSGVSISYDGSYLYEIGFDSKKIYQYDLDEAYDLSSAEYIRSIDTQDTAPRGVGVSSDGSYLFEIDSDADTIYQYNLDTPFDLSSAEYIQSIDSQDSYPTGVSVSYDGSYLFEIGLGSDKIYQYSMDWNTVETDTGELDVDKYHFWNYRYDDYDNTGEPGFGWEEYDSDAEHGYVERISEYDGEWNDDLLGFDNDNLYVEERQNTKSVHMYHDYNEVEDYPYMKINGTDDVEFPVHYHIEFIHPDIRGLTKIFISDGVEEVQDEGMFAYLAIEPENNRITYYEDTIPDPSISYHLTFNLTQNEVNELDLTFDGRGSVRIGVKNSYNDNSTVKPCSKLNSEADYEQLQLRIATDDYYIKEFYSFYDDIGIYYDGVSQAKEEFGTLYSEAIADTYEEGEYKSITVDGIEGQLQLTYENLDAERIYIYPEGTSQNSEHIEFDNERYDLWDYEIDVGGDSLDDPRYMFWINGSGYVKLSDFSIASYNPIYLYEVDEPDDKYPMDMTFDTFLGTDSRFYVENNNLYAITEGVSDIPTYMSCRFDLTNLTQYHFINYSVKYDNYKTNWHWDSVMKIGFTDGNYLGYSFPTDEYRVSNTYSRQVPDYKYLKYFALNITYDGGGGGDNQINEMKISPITFTYIPSGMPEITSWTFMNMIIVLIIVFAPSISLRELIDEAAFIPTFTLMTVLCYATEIIPTWLFIITLIGIGLYAISTNNNNSEVGIRL